MLDPRATGRVGLLFLLSLAVVGREYSFINSDPEGEFTSKFDT